MPADLTDFRYLRYDLAQQIVGFSGNTSGLNSSTGKHVADALLVLAGFLEVKGGTYNKLRLRRKFNNAGLMACSANQHYRSPVAQSSQAQPYRSTTVKPA